MKKNCLDEPKNPTFHVIAPISQNLISTHVAFGIINVGDSYLDLNCVELSTRIMKSSRITHLYGNYFIVSFILPKYASDEK